MEKAVILSKLIKEGEELTTSISVIPRTPGVLGGGTRYRSNMGERYQNWQSAVVRLIKNHFSSDFEEIKEAMKRISPGDHQRILGTLRAIEILPEEPENVGQSSGTSITIHNTQKVVLNLFVDAIKDEIAGKDYKALKEILKNYEREPKETASKLKKKLKSFGENVLTNIVTNILTHPNIYSALM